jgi:protein ImuB
MTSTLYACAWAAEFPAQALVRMHPELAREAVVVLDGSPPQQTVCSLNRHAQQLGAAAGMTRLEAEAMGNLKLLTRSTANEEAARKVFLECSAQFSPRMEEAGEGTACAIVLDIAGTSRLFGPPQQFATRLRAALLAAGFRTSIAVSANYDTARMKAAAARGIAVVPAGEEASALAALPVSALGIEAGHEETFTLWGIRTLGELAALPENDLVARLGPQAQRWRALASGAAEHTLQPIEPEFALEEFCAFETPVEQLDSLLFVGARMIDCLAARAATRALLLARLTVRMKLEDGTIHERTLRPALPTADRKFLLKLLQLEMGTHPPQAAVLALTLTAEAGQSSLVQLGLFAPQTPEPSRLDVTLARLKALVGEGHVGAPVLEDSHRPESFRVEDFSLRSDEIRDGNPQTRVPHLRRDFAPKVGDQDSSTPNPRMALRRVRPPAPVHMTFHDGRPAAFHARENRFEIAAAYGPWRASGCWWADAWDLEEWDVLATRADGAAIACLLTCDRARNAWHLEAYCD